MNLLQVMATVHRGGAGLLAATDAVFGAAYRLYHRPRRPAPAPRKPGNAINPDNTPDNTVEAIAQPAPHPHADVQSMSTRSDRGKRAMVEEDAGIAELMIIFPAVCPNHDGHYFLDRQSACQPRNAVVDTLKQQENAIAAALRGLADAGE